MLGIPRNECGHSRGDRCLCSVNCQEACPFEDEVDFCLLMPVSFEGAAIRRYFHDPRAHGGGWRYVAAEQSEPGGVASRGVSPAFAITLSGTLDDCGRLHRHDCLRPD